MAGKARFWDRIARKYARTPIKDEAAYQQKLEKTRAYLTPNAEVYEFGCGTGSTAIAHAPYAKHILATDISANMIAIARSKAEAADIQNVTFRQEEAETVAEGGGPYDMVMAHSILHLLEDRDAAIARSWRLLKPGGVFVSSTACLSDGMGWFRFIAPAGRLLGLIPYVAFFSRENLKASVRAAGFRIEHEWQPGKNKAVFIVAVKEG
jgi:ubiquinone/menaquinone biosynthesis C-methylase UbiE